MQIVNATTDLLNKFLERSDLISEHFRYFKTRDIKVIENHKLTLIGLEDNIPIAYGHIDYEKDNWLGICVLNGYQGKGYGKEIMEELIKYADTNRVDLKLSVDKNNLNAIYLYNKYDFNQYKSNDSVIYMERTYRSKG